MIGSIYKRGLNRVKIIKDYSFEHYTVLEWGVNIKPFIHVSAKKEINNLKQII